MESEEKKEKHKTDVHKTEHHKPEEIVHESHEKIHEKTKSHNKITLTEKFRENPWILATFICGILTVILLGSMFAGNFTGNVISANTAGEKVLDFFTSLGYEGLTIDSVKEVSGVYEIGLTYEGETSPIYVTKDGKNIISSLTPIESESSSETEMPAEVAEEEVTAVATEEAPATPVASEDALDKAIEELVA